MFKKILPNYFIIIVLLLVTCEDFYNFEANKLDGKAFSYLNSALTRLLVLGAG